jgi:hypothetical protein
MKKNHVTTLFPHQVFAYLTPVVATPESLNSVTQTRIFIASNLFHQLNQWPFQEPKLEVPTIYKAYVRPM